MARPRKGGSPHPKIGPRQLDEVRRHGPAALDWQRRVGLNEARSRCVSMVIAGLMPFFGWLWLDWTPTAMLLFLGIDVVAVLVSDLLKLAIAYPAVRHAHAEDHRTQRVLNIVGGLADGTGTYVETGSKTSPLLLYAMAVVFSGIVFMGLYAGLEQLGLERVRAVDQTWFVWIAAATAAMHIVPALFASLATRLRPDPGHGLFLDCGGVLGLGVGMLVLIWLPLTLGGIGAVLMLLVLFLFRLGFGVFALIYIPRVTARLEGFVRDPDSLRLPPTGPLHGGR